MYISAGLRDIQLYLSLSLYRTCTGYRNCLFFFLKNVEKNILEPALNHEMVRAVLTKCQTSDCDLTDIKCRITFITKGSYCRRMWNSKH